MPVPDLTCATAARSQSSWLSWQFKLNMAICQSGLAYFIASPPLISQIALPALPVSSLAAASAFASVDFDSVAVAHNRRTLRCSADWSSPSTLASYPAGKQSTVYVTMSKVQQ